MAVSDETIATVTDSRAGYVAEGPARVEIAAGTRIDRYLIDRRIGAGGMGVVYAARDPDLDRQVAIKLLGPRTGSWSRLLREGQAVARLRHPNIVAIYDVGAHASELFIAMELVDGANLREWVRARPRAWRDVCATFAQAGRGLAAAHARGIVHRDFKPDNVLVGDDGRVVVTDFGLACEGGDPGDSGSALEVTRSGELAGTPAYMSPEQLAGGTLDARSDQFSFCVALWEALYGARPFRAETLSELRDALARGRIAEPSAKISARVHRAMKRGLAIDPAARHPSMEALIATLEPPRARTWIALGAIAAIGTIAVADITHHAPTATIDPCASVSSRLASPDDGRRTTDDGSLDRFAMRWKAMRRDACTRGDDHRALCLDLAARSFDSAVAHADPSRWPALPSLARCAGAAPDVAPSIHALGLYSSHDDTLVFAPDGGAIARTEHGRLHLTTIDGKDRAVFPLRGSTLDLRWTPDGRIVVSDATGLAAVDRSTGAITPVGAAAPMSSMSPDASMLVSAHDDALWIAPADGHAPPRKLAPIDGNLLGAAWSRDGARFAVSLHPSAQTPILRVVEIATGVYRDLPIRVRRPLTREPIPFAFLDDHRIAIDGDLDDDHGQGVWIVDVRPDGEPPEPRLEAPPGTAYSIVDGAANRAIAMRHVVHDHFGRLVAGALDPIAGIGDGMVLVGIDRAGARLSISKTSREGSPLGWMSLADGSIAPIAAPPDGGTPVIRGDTLDVIAGKAGAWRVDELGADGGWHARAKLAIESDTEPKLACGPAPAERCVLVWHDHGWRVAALDRDFVVGAPIAIHDRVAITVSVSPDGKRAAIACIDDAVTVVDLDLARATDWPGVPGCYHQYTAFSRTGDGLYTGLICATGDSYALARLVPGKPPQTLYRGKAWVGPPALGPHDELYVNLRSFDEDFVVIDGL
ncbi:MAG TPA: serine/threonine-protein kinase [Kofleriaceae bacterium]|nr:serine/threonine-protein kinase [Kofleriaceae bacterium]